MNSNMKNCLPGADRFCTGVNYRASHAGINMWKDFSPEEMEKDFIALKESGMNTILTRNPYPAFTPHCGKSPLNTVPAIYHATAESLFYRGVSGKMTFIEKIGSFGPNYLSEEREEKYIYTTLYSALAHSLVGITKHTLPDGKTLKLYINYSAEIPVTGWRATV